MTNESKSRLKREDAPGAGATSVSLRDWLRAGPFALTMSSGFFGFYAHTGFMTVLEDEGLLPGRLTGSSAGALVGSSWAAGVEAPALARELEALERKDFWDPGAGPGLLRGKLFRERLERILPKSSYDECRVPAGLSVFDVLTRKTHVIERGAIAPAIQASCAVPLLFHPVWIDRRAYWDGGILDRPGLLAMPAAEKRVLFHHLASKSPWRSALHMPEREGMVTFVIRELPRSGPFKLGEGRRAFKVAREATKRALDRPIERGTVVI